MANYVSVIKSGSTSQTDLIPIENCNVGHMDNF